MGKLTYINPGRYLPGGVHPGAGRPRLEILLKQILRLEGNINGRQRDKQMIDFFFVQSNGSNLHWEAWWAVVVGTASFVYLEKKNFLVSTFILLQINRFFLL